MAKQTPDESSADPPDAAQNQPDQADPTEVTSEATIDVTPGSAGQTLGGANAARVESPASQKPSAPAETAAIQKPPLGETDADLGATIDVPHGLPEHTASEAADEPLDQTVVVTSGQRPPRQGDAETGRAPTSLGEPTGDPSTQHTVTRFLAEGGLGKVYVAQDDELQRAVVMKTLKEAEGENSEARYRFVQEAQVNSQLEHPNIVPIYQAGRGADGQPYYTMKYVRGQEYRELIQSYHQHRREGNVDALELRRLLTLFISTCQAVSYAHNRGVVHRDLKPENVAVGEFGELMVLDWGLAKVLGEPDTETSHAAVTVADGIDLGQTMQGRIMGTPGYMAPEQASGESDAIEPRTDVYSLGAMLFEILTGEAPHALLHSYDSHQIQRWQRRESHAGTAAGQESVSSLASQHSSGHHENTMKLLARVIAGTVPAPSDIEPTVPRALEAICQRAMRLKIEDRYTTASDLAADVERWLADEPVSVYAGSWNERLGRWMRKHRTKVQAIGASFAVIALVAVVSSVLINNQKQLAVKESQRAVAAEQNASQEADRAKAAERIASQEAARARAAERIAVAKTAQAERSAYSSDMLLAESDWEDASIRHLTDLLDRYRERQDLKGFEWNYWDRLAASHLLSLAAHTGNVTSVSFSSDGTRLVSGSADTTVKVWDVVTGREMLTFKGHTKQVKSVSFSPDGTRLVSGSADTTVKIWDLATGQEMLTFKGHTKPVSSVSFSPDGTRLASGSMDKTAKLWDALTGEEILTLAGNAHRVTFSPDGSRLATTVNDFAVRLWDTATGSKLLTLPGHTGIVSSVSFSPDGKQLASASWDRTVKLWDATTGQELFTFKGHAKSVHSVSFSPDGRQVASAGADQKVIVWDAVAGQETLSLKGHGPFVNSVVFSPDGTRLASGGNDTNVRVWDAATGQQLLTFKGHAKPVYSVSFSPDGTRLASASWDHTVKVWDVDTGQEMLTFKGHTKEVSSVRFSPDGKQLASASWDQTVKVWDTATGQ
ncbi:MAG: protein kinase, partial [Planctomycetota bacterium]|nr:protein kinase [Planctomycetota bacterium]